MMLSLSFIPVTSTGMQEVLAVPLLKYKILQEHLYA